MSVNTPCSPLSPNSSSDGSGSNMQDHISPSHNYVQSSNPSVLDGFRLNHTHQLDEPPRPISSDALKLGMGGNRSDLKLDVE